MEKWREKERERDGEKERERERKREKEREARGKGQRVGGERTSIRASTAWSNAVLVPSEMSLVMLGSAMAADQWCAALP